jgi:hypothetical protein
LYRLWHGLGLQGRLRFLRRVLLVECKVARSAVIDLAERASPSENSNILCMKARARLQLGARRVTFHAHYCVSSRARAMVMEQMRAYSAAGFAVVFVTASPAVAMDDRAQVRSVARPRGASTQQKRPGFRRLVRPCRYARRPLADIEELLLVNDSVLGPIRPLEPLFVALRSGGEELFGLTDSFRAAAICRATSCLAADAPSFRRC